MKKILSLLVLMCMSCIGAWAGVVISNTPTAVEDLSATKLYAVFIKQCYQANNNSGATTADAGYLYKDANAGTRVKATTTFPTSTPLNAAWILTRNNEGGITLRNGYESKSIIDFELKNTGNESGFDLSTGTAGIYKPVGNLTDGYTLQGYNASGSFSEPNRAWLNYNTSDGLWVAYAADRAAKFQFFELAITDDNALTEQYISDGNYYIRTYNDAMYDTFQPYVTDNGSTMRLTAKSSLSNNVGIWHITQVATTEGNYAYKIRSVQNPENYWTHGTNAPMSGSFAKYAITYDNNRKAYRFNGHSTEDNIQNKKCVTPKSATEFERAREASAATDADFFELIPVDDVYEVTYNITASNAAGDQISWSENKWVVGTDASAGLAQISYDFFNDFAISDANTTIDEDHTAFNVTANHTLPMVPGKFYQIKQSSYYMQRQNETVVSLRAACNQTNPANLWYVKNVANAPYFYLYNVDSEKAVNALDNSASACTEGEVADPLTYSGTIYAIEFKQNSSNFSMFQAGTTKNLGTHGTLGSSANHALGLWNNANTPFSVQEFDESIFTATSKYVGDLTYNSTETFETYLDSKTAANLKAALDYYNDVATNKTKTIEIDANKFYVIESACSAFTDGTPRAIYAAYNETYEHSGKTYPDYLKWKKYSADDNSFIFRFQKENHYESGVTWTTYDNPAQTATDVYSIYNVAAPRNAYVGVSDYDGRYGMRKRGELAVGNSNNGSARGNDGGIFAVLPIATTNQFAIVARFNGNGWTENKMDCSTMSVKQGSNPTANTESGDVYTYNTAAVANDYHAWRIREVEAPTLEDVSIAISAAGAATFYTGKTLEIPAGVTAKILADDSAKDTGNGVYHLTYTPLENEIPAGTAVVLTGEATTYQFPRSLEPHDYVETNVAASADNRLIGTLASDVAATGYGQEGTLYALGNNPGIAGVAFYHFLGETLTAGKAYLDANGLGVAGSSVRAFAVFDEDNTITGINLVETASDNAEVFDLQGRRVQSAKSGLYIVNGKKVIR